MFKLLSAASLLALSLAAGCARVEGSPCTIEDDCGDLICAREVICADRNDCTGTCAFSCATDEDCEEGLECFDEPGTSRGYCRYIQAPSSSEE